MANKKISDLTAATTPLAGTELLELVQSGASTKVAASDVAATAVNVRTVATGGTGAATLTGYVYGNGTSAMTAATTIPYASLAGRAILSAYDTTDQTGNIAAATAVEYGTQSIETGITVVTDGAADTRITYAVTGTYMLSTTIQLANSDAADQDVTIWLAKNGTAIAETARIQSVPKAGDGGRDTFSATYFLALTAADYIQVMWLPENAAVTIEAIAAGAIAPAIPSTMVVSERVA